jgi:hypothetical protein
VNARRSRFHADARYSASRASRANGPTWVTDELASAATRRAVCPEVGGFQCVDLIETHGTRFVQLLDPQIMGTQAF